MRIFIPLLFLFSSFLSQAHPTTRLWLIGGGVRPLATHQAFIRATHGKPIWIIAWATSEPEVLYPIIEKELNDAGAKKVNRAPDPLTMTPALLKKFKLDLLRAGGIYFPGGSQVNLYQSLDSNHLVSLIRTLYENGLPVIGTSAGTAVQSNPMLSEEKLYPGLGLLPHFLIDQHFLVRHREERLLRALGELNDSQTFGLGPDQDMSVQVTNGKEFLGIGPSKVEFYELKEGKKPTDTDAYVRLEIKDGEKLNLIHGKLIPAGSRVD